VLTLALMAVYSVPLTLVALRPSPATRCCAGLLQAAARVHRGDAGLRGEAGEHFLESLRGVQAIKLFNAPGRPPVALRQPRRRRDERRDRDAQARARVRVAAPAAVRLERVVVIGSARCWCWTALSVGMLFAFFAYKEQFARASAR
jgi:ATP-binding cassette subfamily B protein RaxB